MGKTLLEKKVAKAFAKSVVLVVANLNHAIFYLEGVAVVVPQFAVAQFGSPAVQGFPIE